MKVLVLNCGSSSLKYQVLDMTDERLLAKGVAEKIGSDQGLFTHEKIDADKVKKEVPMPSHKEAISEVLKSITEGKLAVLKGISELGAVGHRVVHGGEKYSASVIIDDKVKENIELCADLAPLHNPANLLGINVMQELLPNTPQIAVFDTAFHQTMPPEHYMYALPYEYYEKYGIRRYGFHGTSHKYVAERTASILGTSIESLKIVTCHLGNGASVSAIKRGKCIDTSMGFTPLPGLIMGTRCGSIDPAIIDFVMQKEGKSIEEMMHILNWESGMLGISGVGSDFRDIEEAIAEGNKRAELSLKMFAEKVKFYIGAYIAQMNGIDALVFTAGIGENDIQARDIICSELYNLGIKLDLIRNKVRGKETIISPEGAAVKVLLVPTNEELMIARDAYKLASAV